jgi:hypothetical protein
MKTEPMPVYVQIPDWLIPYIIEKLEEDDTETALEELKEWI